MKSDFTIPPTQGDPEFNLALTLGRIEGAIVTMAADIHEAVVAQKAIVERLEKDEQRLASLEEWRRSTRDRNDGWAKVALIVLVPFAVWSINTGMHLARLSQKLELHEQVFPKYYKP